MAYLVQKIQTGSSSPFPLVNACVEAVGSRVMLFGGFNGKYTADLYILETGLIFCIQDCLVFQCCMMENLYLYQQHFFCFLSNRRTGYLV